MKKFYSLMITMLAVLMGTAGCVDESSPKYGVIHDDNTFYDEDVELDEDVVNDTDVPVKDDPVTDCEYGVLPTDYDSSDRDVDEVPDTDYNPVTDCEYGVPPADYDADDSDVSEVPDEPAVKTDYDESPDEMTTDYGPISVKYEK